MPGDPSERKQERAREPVADDFRAAEEVLARLMSSLDRDADEYHDKRQALAQFRAEVGGDRFDLRYGLRPPRGAVERAEIDFSQGRITQDQFREALKADAERPIDAAMLDAFCDAYAERLLAYSRMLQTVIAIATDQREPDAWRRREPEVDRHVEAMKAKLPLWNEQVATVFAFLTELQAERKGEPVRCGDHSAESAHMLAILVMDHAAEGWRGCKETAARSRTDPRYLYATSASHLFYKAHLPGLPMPNDLMSLMVLERAAALKVLRERQRSAEAVLPAPASIKIHAETINVTTPNVTVTADRAHGGGAAKKKARAKREVAESLILERLKRRPHDTAEEVAQAVRCSVGLVAESPAWQANQKRLKIAAKEGRDPKAVNLDPTVMNVAGGKWSGQMHEAHREKEIRDDEIDRRERELFQRIGDYQKEHPKAAPQEVARAVECTAGDVERRQAMLNRLAAEQAESQKEDGGKPCGDSAGTPAIGRQPQKWVRKQP